MAIVLVNGGALDHLNSLTAGWSGKRRIGLFTGDWTPERLSTIEDVEPAKFSGYTGLTPVVGWMPATIVGERAVTRAAALRWEHNGGPLSGWVSGYYIVNPDGALMWAERLPDGPVALIYEGDKLTVIPRFSVGSRYPREEA